MTFLTRFQGNEQDRSGTASFNVGSIEREVHFADAADFHAVAQLLNEAYQLGREASAREFWGRAREWARSEGV